MRGEDANDWVDRMDAEFEREQGVPTAEIKQTGAFMWDIIIRHGWLTWGPDGMPFMHFGSRKSAERRASRLLLRYWRKMELDEAPHIRVV